MEWSRLEASRCAVPRSLANRPEGVLDRQVKGAIKGVEVGFASLEDLVRVKEAAGRPKDLEDLRHLRLPRPPG